MALKQFRGIIQCGTTDVLRDCDRILSSSSGCMHASGLRGGFREGSSAGYFDFPSLDLHTSPEKGKKARRD